MNITLLSLFACNYVRQETSRRFSPPSHFLRTYPLGRRESGHLQIELVDCHVEDDRSLEGANVEAVA